MKATRERILDAAWSLTIEGGWSSVTMSRLGDLAGVSRQSVYNEFGSKPQVAQELIAREVAGFLAVVDEQIALGDTPADSVHRAAEAVFALAAGNPLVRATVGAAVGTPSDLLPLLTSQSAPVIETAAARVTAGLRERFDDLPGPTELPQAVDAIVRLVISHVVQPGDPPDMAYIGARLLAP